MTGSGSRQIDLIPPDRIRRREVRKATRRWSRRLAAVAVLFVAALVWILGEARQQVREESALRARYANLQKTLEIAENLIAERDRLAGRREAIARIQDEPAVSRLLELTAEALPGSTYLRRVMIEPEPGDDPSAGLRLVLGGVAPEHAEIGDMMRALRSSGRFTTLTLISAIERAGANGDHEVDFQLACRTGSGGSGG